MQSCFERKTAIGIEIAKSISDIPILETVSMAELLEDGRALISYYLAFLLSESAKISKSRLGAKCASFR